MKWGEQERADMTAGARFTRALIKAKGPLIVLALITVVCLGANKPWQEKAVIGGILFFFVVFAYSFYLRVIKSNSGDIGPTA